MTLIRVRAVLLLACLFTPAVAYGQPVFNSAASDGNGSTASLTFAMTITGSNRYMACAVATQDTSKTGSSVTFNGVSLTQLTSMDNADDAGRQSRVEYWYLIAPDATTANVVVTVSAATALAAGCVSYTGVHQTSPHSTTPATAKGDGSSVTVNVSSASDEVVVDATSIRTGTTTITAGSGQTERVERQSAAGFGNTTLGMSQKAGASTVSMNWAIDDGTAKAWTIIAVPLKAAASPPPPPPPSGSQIRVCASGCEYTNAQLQNALNAASDGYEVLLETFQTYTAPDNGFVMGQKCANPTWNCITVRTGVTALGAVLNPSLFPADGVRMSTSYRSALAKLVPGVNNSPAIRTVWPSEDAACSPVCVGSGWTLKWLEFSPKSDWLKGRMVLFGSNKSSGDNEVAFAHNAQDTLAEVPDYLTMTQCDMHGDQYAGQAGGIYLSSKNTRVTNNSITDIKSLTETQGITEINGVGPFLIENNLVEATGENIMFGGGDSKLQQSTTITGSPTVSSITLTATTELFSGQFITVTHAGVEYSGLVCTLTGSTCALAPSMTVTPSAGDVVKWNRMAGGATIRLNAFTRPLSWRDAIVPVPTGVSVSCSTTGGSLSAGTYYYRVAGRRYMGADGDAESAASTEQSGTVLSGTTGSCLISFTESVANTGGTFIFGRTTGTQSTRWSVADGATSYTDTGSAGTADTPRATGDIWVVKNSFELKHLDGGAPAGPNVIEGNVIGPSWCCSQNMAVNFKAWNQQDGGSDKSSTVRNVTFRKNLIYHTVRCINLTTSHAENGPSGVMTDVTIEDNLCSDLSSAWGGGFSAIQVTTGNYGNHVGSRGGKRITIQHNTLLADTNDLTGPMWFVNQTTADTHSDFVLKNNIMARDCISSSCVSNGVSSLKTYNPNNVGQGTVAWNAAVSGASAASFNVWPDGSSGTYSFSTSSKFPTNSAMQAALVSYASCFADILTGCALSGATVYDNAGSDGRDMGADIAAMKALTDIALSGVNSGSTDTPPDTSGHGTRLRIRIRGL